FSCSCLVAHRSVLSFPTRRSSDLGVGERERGAGHERAIADGSRAAVGVDAAEREGASAGFGQTVRVAAVANRAADGQGVRVDGQDRKSTRLNSSHRTISYAVFCLK